MAKGKKTDNETVYKIMCLYAVHNNYSEVGRILNVPRKTVEKLVKEHINDKEFAEICQQKKEEFVEVADRIIFEIWNTDKEELNETQKKSLVQKISKLQINGLSEITTSIGIMYDKKRIAETGIVDPETPNININIVDNSNLEKVMYEDNKTE